MKKLLALVLIAGTISFTATAQVQPNDNQNKDHERNGRQMRDGGRGGMMKDLNLSEQQKSQMKDFMQDSRAKREAIQNDNSLSEDQKKAKLMNLRKEQQEKMNTILTPEQREKMKVKMKERRGDGDGFRKQRDPVVTNPDNK